eukprot:COSAG06_NODE_20805_length_780_cov_1.649046_1_plen_203_part_01
MKRVEGEAPQGRRTRGAPGGEERVTLPREAPAQPPRAVRAVPPPEARVERAVLCTVWRAPKTRSVHSIGSGSDDASAPPSGPPAGSSTPPPPARLSSGRSRPNGAGSGSGDPAKSLYDRNLSCAHTQAQCVSMFTSATRQQPGSNHSGGANPARAAEQEQTHLLTHRAHEMLRRHRTCCAVSIIIAPRCFRKRAIKKGILPPG